MRFCCSFLTILLLSTQSIAQEQSPQEDLHRAVETLTKLLDEHPEGPTYTRRFRSDYEKRLDDFDSRLEQFQRRLSALERLTIQTATVVEMMAKTAPAEPQPAGPTVSPAQEVAVRWAEALFEKKADDLVNASGLPFSWNGEAVFVEGQPLADQSAAFALEAYAISDFKVSVLEDEAAKTALDNYYIGQQTDSIPVKFFAKTPHDGVYRVMLLFITPNEPRSVVGFYSYVADDPE